MTEYRRFYIAKALWFFIVNLTERKNNPVRSKKLTSYQQPFGMNAVVIMPDHCIAFEDCRQMMGIIQRDGIY